ncbi:MAG: flagellar hook-length control protein FliK [Clostridiales bacterium]|nr:flagellar hook-length control protein FliK [Clostridiales bacterium]
MELSSSGSRIVTNHPGQGQASRTSGHTVGRLSNYAQNQPLTQIREGQVLRGEVTDLRNHEITLTLEDNTTVHARISNASSLSIGDTASFLVDHIVPGRITLEMIPQSQLASENNIIRRVLEESMLPKNEHNQTVVRELIHNQLPINKQSILDMLHLSATNPDIGIKSLALMKKYSIPLTRENMASFESYRNGTHALSSQFSELSDQIGTLLSDSSSLYGTDLASHIGSKVIATLLSSSKPEFLPSAEELTYLDNLSVPESGQKAGETLAELLSGYELSDETVQSIQNHQISLPALAKIILSIKENSTDSNEDGMISTQELLEHPLFKTILEDYQTYQTEHSFIGGFFTGEERAQLLDALENFPLGQAMRQKITDGTASQKETLNIIKNLLSFSKSEDTEKLLSNTQFQTLIKNQFQENFLLTPKKLLAGSNPDSSLIPDYYHQLASQLKEFSSLADTLPKSNLAAAFSETLENTAANISFLNTLNQFYPYVQLPMELPNQTANPDLYVFARKKSSLSDGKPVSVLLRLNLAHLGSLDVHLTIEGNQVTSKFYLNDEEGKRLLKNNISLLREPLNDQGYTLTSEFLKKDQDFDLVKDLIARDAPPAGNIRYNFDIRA